MLPRTIPLSTRLVVLFGGAIQQFAWAFASFGLFFSLLFVPHADDSFLSFRGPTAERAGSILQVAPTSFSRGASARRPHRQVGGQIQAYHYEWTDASGAKHAGVSYSASHDFSAGDAVTVEYLVGEPTRSRIVGMDRAPLGAGAWLVLLFPLIGGVLVLWGRAQSRAQLRALQLGSQATATVVQVHASRRARNRTTYRLELDLGADAGRHTAHSTDPRYAQVGAIAPVLHLKERVERVFLLDDIPGRPQVEESGAVAELSWLSAGLRMLLPALAAAIFAFLILD
jgi:hypothetical protein